MGLGEHTGIGTVQMRMALQRKNQYYVSLPDRLRTSCRSLRLLAFL